MATDVAQKDILANRSRRVSVGVEADRFRSSGRFSRARFELGLDRQDDPKRVATAQSAQLVRLHWCRDIGGGKGWCQRCSRRFGEKHCAMGSSQCRDFVVARCTDPLDHRRRNAIRQSRSSTRKSVRRRHSRPADLWSWTQRRSLERKYKVPKRATCNAIEWTETKIESSRVNDCHSSESSRSRSLPLQNV